jgi:hypothetical protein
MGFFAESLSNVSVILWFGNVSSPSLDVNSPNCLML